MSWKWFLSNTLTLYDPESEWDLPEEMVQDNAWCETVRWWLHNGTQPIWNGVANNDWVKMWEMAAGTRQRSEYIIQKNWMQVRDVMAHNQPVGQRTDNAQNECELGHACTHSM